MLLQLPITAFLLLGLSRGLYWLGATLLIGAVCYVTAVTGIGFTQLLERPDVVDAMDFSMQLVLLGLVAGALIIYEMLNGLLNRQLHEERNRFEHKASHDDLTGLPNRTLLADRIQQARQAGKEQGGCFALMFIDLDGFKPVNDAFGHHLGDQLLREVGQRLREDLRSQDTLARIGGDEFVLLVQLTQPMMTRRRLLQKRQQQT